MKGRPEPMATRLLTFALALAVLSAAQLANAEDLSNIEWTTNYDDPPIGDPTAKKGGTFYDFIQAYPLTFRLVGPNSNDDSAGWRRSFSMHFSLTEIHPQTDNYIPWMATHWSIQDDMRTVYYKLDPDARWSDGKPVTADDYVFTWKMFLDENIVDPFYNRFAEERLRGSQEDRRLHVEDRR